MHNIALLLLTVKEAPKDVAEDPYGSLWMETDQPMKAKKRRRSCLLLNKMTKPPDESEEHEKIADNDNGEFQKSIDNGLSQKENDTMSVQQFSQANVQIEKDTTTENVRIESGICITDIGLNKVTPEIIRIESDISNTDIGLNKVTPGGTVDVVSTEEPIHNLSPVASRSPEKNESQTVHQINSECTPPDEQILSTPQSMSPEFPASPSDLLDLESHDNSYTSYIEFVNKETGSKHTTSDDVKETDMSVAERLTVVPETDSRETSVLQLSETTEMLETSASDKENTVLSLSDKENTLIENTSLESKDNNKNSDSPGFLSLCKTFAEKVVDLVKTSPSYLTNILQDNSKISSSPSLKEVDIYNKEPSQEDNNVSYSDIRLALASELGKTLDREIECNEQLVQVFSVTETTNSSATKEQNESSSRRNETEFNETERKTDVDLKPNEPLTKKGKTKKRRKSVSRTFYDTYTAVSNELNRTVNQDTAVNNGETSGKSISEPLCANSTSETQESVSTSRRSGCTAFKAKTFEKNANEDNDKHTSLKAMTNESKRGAVEILDTAIKSKTFEKIASEDDDKHTSLKAMTNESKRGAVDRELDSTAELSSLSEAQKQIKCKRRRSAGAVLSTDYNISMNQNVVHSDDMKEPGEKKKKYFSDNFFTEIKEQSNAENVSEVQPKQQVVTAHEGSSNDSDRVNLTDSEASVVEDFSRLELQISIPEPLGLKKDNAIKKKGRRRRSNNFYFSSIYNENDDPVNDLAKTQSASDLSNDKTESLITEQLVAPTETLAVGNNCPVSKVIEEISQVSIDDKTEERLPPKVDDSDAEVGIKRRRRRKSADAATLKIQMIANEIQESPVAEENYGPTTVVKQGRKRKNEPDIPLEDIYRNKNYKKPEDKTWETIFESPKSLDQYYSKRRMHTCIDFEKPTQTKLKRRLQRAVRNGWDPKKRKKTVLSEDLFQLKIADAFSELDEIQENSSS